MSFTPDPETRPVAAAGAPGPNARSGGNGNGGGATTPKDVIGSVVDILKTVTSLATAVLAFSIGLTITSTTSVYSQDLKWLILAGWVLLAIAVFFGAVGLFYVPTLYSSVEFTIYSAEMRVVTGVTQTAFFVGSVLVGVFLVSTLVRHDRISTATSAVRVAATQIDKNMRIEKVDTVELLKGAVPARRDQETWHVRFALGPRAAPARKPPQEPAMLDVYIDRTTGTPYVPAR